MTTYWGAPTAVTALITQTWPVRYIYKPLTTLESSCFRSKATEEFKSANDQILTNHPGKKPDTCYLPHFAETET